MPQVFHPAMNTIARGSVFGFVFLIAAACGVGWMVVRSPWFTEAGVVRTQPIPFSHRHHVGEAGIDCRFCHRTVTTEASAGIPSTEICRTCHSQLWSDAPMLSAVQTSWSQNRPLHWTRVHDLPDYAYFHHGVHVRNGVACESCHGRVDEMPLTWRNATLHMEWCLDCHRHPERNLRPAEAVFAMGWIDHAEASKTPAAYPEVQPGTHCSTCHR